MNYKRSPHVQTSKHQKKAIYISKLYAEQISLFLNAFSQNSRPKFCSGRISHACRENSITELNFHSLLYVN